MANYTIKPGDTLAKLAQQNNTSVEELMRVNPNITDKNMIFAGSNLNLPEVSQEQSLVNSFTNLEMPTETGTTATFTEQLGAIDFGKMKAPNTDLLGRTTDINSKDLLGRPTGGQPIDLLNPKSDFEGFDLDFIKDDPFNKEKEQTKKETTSFELPIVEKSLEQTLTAFGAAAKKDEEGNRDILGMGLAGGASLIKGVRAGLTGYGIANSQQQAAQEARDKVDTELRDNYNFKEGGEVTESELETGAYLTGLQVFLKPNAEVEDGEYVNQPGEDGIQEVVGAKHEDGGVEVTLEKGAKVISNAGTPSKEDIKEFKKEYNLKVGKKETYADVIDKYTKKIGLDKVIEEHAGLLEKIEDQQDVDDTATARLNLQILVEKNTKLEERRRDLEKTREEFSDMIFEKQEMAKPEGERSSQFKYGGTYDKEMVDEIREQYGLTPDQAEEILQSNELPKYTEGGGTSLDKLNTDQIIKTAIEINPGIALAAITSLGYFYKNEGNEKTVWPDYTFPVGNNDQQEQVYRVKPTDEVDKQAIELMFNELPQAQKDKVAESITKDEATNIAIQDFNKKLKAGNLPGQISQTGQTPQVDLAPKTTLPGKTEDKTDLSDTQADIDARLNPPFQYTAPPSSLQLSTKVTPEYHTIEGNKVSPEAGLVEINRAAQSAMDVARSSGTAQGEAMMADILAQQMQATTGAVGQADAINAQEQARVDAYNAQVADKQSLSEAQSALDYEAKTFKAQDTTNQDIQSYFDFYNKQNIDNYNAQKNLELLNQFQDKYWFNPETNKVEIKEGSANVTPRKTESKKTK